MLFVVFGLALSMESGQGLFGYDEFTSTSPQLIQEVVEDELGNNCDDCNTTLRVNFPNGTLHGFFWMIYNASASAYEKQLNLTLVGGNTTRYAVTVSANRTTDVGLFNGTSDRTAITIYGIFPPQDSQWDVGLVLMLLTIQWVFVLLAYRFFDEHVIIKYTFILIALFFNSWLMALGGRILAINGIVTSNFTRLFDSTATLGIILNFLFTAYIMIYVIYYLIHSVMRESKNMQRRLG